MKVKLKRLTKPVYAGMFLLIIKTVFFYSTVVPYTQLIDNILQFSAVACFLYSILRQGYSKKTLFIYAVVTLIALYSCYVVGEWGMLISVTTILAIRRENINKVIDFIYCYELIFVVLNVLISLIMFLFGRSITSTYYGKTVLTLGFVHRNALSCFLFNLMLMWLWKNYKRINAKMIAVLFGIVVLLYICIKTKTTAIIMFFILTIIMVNRHSKNYSRLLGIAAAVIVPIFTVSFYWLVSHYGNTISLIIDKLLTYRLQQNAYIFNRYGLSLFGQAITDLSVQWDSIWQLNGRLTFDCLYTYLLISRGIVWIVGISFIFVLFAKKKNNKVNVFIVAWAMYGIAEMGGINCFQCFPILLSAALFDHKFKEIID